MEKKETIKKAPAKKFDYAKREKAGSAKRVNIEIVKDHGDLKKGNKHVVSEDTAEILKGRGIAK